MDELGAYCGASPHHRQGPCRPNAPWSTPGSAARWPGRRVAAKPVWTIPNRGRTIAWSILTDADHDDDGAVDAAATGNVIGMIFLIDIDGWARSARIQIVLGKDYRGRRLFA